MIHSGNIKDYINFLHLKKYSAPAAEELKSRWSTLTDAEIPEQLRGLYLHWGIDEHTAREYEQSFSGFQQSKGHMSNAAYQQPAPPPDYAAPVSNAGAPKRSGRAPLYLAIIIVLLGVCGFMFYKMSQPATDPETVGNDSATLAGQNTTSRPEVPQSAVAPETAASVPSTSNVDPDELKSIRTNVISNLIEAEESRDMRGILSCFSRNIQQYWDINNPTQDQITNRYINTWNITSSNTNSNINIVRVSDNVYDMYSKYEYYSNKDGVEKSVNSHVRYVFDDNNKIIKTFGVK